MEYKCPSCSSHLIKKNGPHLNGKQRHRCLACSNLSFGFVFLVAIGDFERISLFLAEMHSQRSYA
ncbi:MAG: transposase-like zinc-binding domain-containing protein [Rhabdochlamydiaceae bacterium]